MLFADSTQFLIYSTFEIFYLRLLFTRNMFFVGKWLSSNFSNQSAHTFFGPFSSALHFCLIQKFAAVVSFLSFFPILRMFFLQSIELRMLISNGLTVNVDQIFIRKYLLQTQFDCTLCIWSHEMIWCPESVFWIRPPWILLVNIWNLNRTVRKLYTFILIEWFHRRDFFTNHFNGLHYCWSVTRHMINNNQFQYNFTRKFKIWNIWNVSLLRLEVKLEFLNEATLLISWKYLAP